MFLPLAELPVVAHDVSVAHVTAQALQIKPVTLQITPPHERPLPMSPALRQMQRLPRKVVAETQRCGVVASISFSVGGISET